MYRYRYELTVVEVIEELGTSFMVQNLYKTRPDRVFIGSCKLAFYLFHSDPSSLESTKLELVTLKGPLPYYYRALIYVDRQIDKTIHGALMLHMYWPLVVKLCAYVM